MARIEQITMVDDLDDAVTEDVITCQFGLGDRTYLIDLGPENREALENFLDRYIEAARPLGGRARSVRQRQAKPLPTKSDRERTHEIRTWAAEQGLPVNTRGRIPASLVEAYEAAH